jgi:hypothetical protein
MDKPPAAKDRTIPEHISAHFHKQQQSGLSIRAYCLQEDISVWSFYDWRKRYKSVSLPIRRKTRAHQQRPVFTSLGSFTMHQTRLTINFPSGMSIGIYHGTPAEEIAPFITLLSGNGTPC